MTIQTLSRPEIPERINAPVSYHSHIYFNAAQRTIAEQLNESLQDNFKIWDYRWLDAPNQLHPSAMFRFALLKEDFQRYVEWILKNRQGLNVLVHPNTGDGYADHTYLAIWLGDKLHLNIKKRPADAPNPYADRPNPMFQTHLAGLVRYRPGDDTLAQPAQPKD
ncbi:DOPA 4,5-dioxygenase family protein [Asticcacaulis tiandongensis]|uniref:DOPA 4,5-dioxygenase family protein n=1 Tax=Asticcacaulis tiandongensis TaxID=2565365 RepID=UPI001126562D|nr:DOPA 4,5-dioxygenase family protein [Asticcacaulis tiandongensis]